MKVMNETGSFSLSINGGAESVPHRIIMALITVCQINNMCCKQADKLKETTCSQKYNPQGPWICLCQGSYDLAVTTCLQTAISQNLLDRLLHGLNASEACFLSWHREVDILSPDHQWMKNLVQISGVPRTWNPKRCGWPPDFSCSATSRLMFLLIQWKICRF